MAETKHSVQRDAILNELCMRKDHPTAEELYLSLRKKYPKISLGTVYRNLSLLSEKGFIKKMNCTVSDRYDGNASPHNHLFCTECKCVYDVGEINPDIIKNIRNGIEDEYSCKVDNFDFTFTGICENCLNKLGIKSELLK